MLAPIERKKLEAESLRVIAAKAEIEVIILERNMEIERLEENVKRQQDRYEEILCILEEKENK